MEMILGPSVWIQRDGDPESMLPGQLSIEEGNLYLNKLTASDAGVVVLFPLDEITSIESGQQKMMPRARIHLRDGSLWHLDYSSQVSRNVSEFGFFFRQVEHHAGRTLVHEVGTLISPIKPTKGLGLLVGGILAAAIVVVGGIIVLVHEL